MRVASDEDFNRLPAHVWPKTATRGPGGEVTIGGVGLTELVERYGSPLFVIDEEDFRHRMRAMADAFGGAHNVHYAAKAFLTAGIVRWVDEEGLSLDVASVEELAVALAAGFPAERITAHGNNKTEEFLELIVGSRVGQVVVDSFEEIDRLSRAAKRAGVQQAALVRVTPGVEAHTHEFIATSHEDQKFGFSLAAGDGLKAARRVVDAEPLTLVGLHCHVGSQVFDADGFSLAAERVLGLYRQLVEEYTPRHRSFADTFNVLDLGGGYGIAYLPEERPLDVAAVARDLLAAVAETAADIGVAPPRVMVEPGRAIAGPTTVTAYRVGTVKEVPVADGEWRRYLAVDGGMSDNIRPALYGAKYDARVVNRELSGEPVATRVVGSHCESGDILVGDAAIPADATSGDVVALAATGAYCYAMASNYNAVGKPAVVSVKDGEVSLHARRQTVADLLELQGLTPPDGGWGVGGPRRRGAVNRLVYNQWRRRAPREP